MFSKQHTIGLCGAVLMLFLPLGSAWGQAERIVLRNDSQTAVFVQVTALFRGQTTLSRPVLLNPRMTMPSIVMPGDKIISLYDARVPTRALFKGTIHSSPINQSYSIQQDAIPPKLKLVQINYNP